MTIQLTPSQADDSLIRQSMLRYLIVLVALPLLLYILPFWIMRIPGYAYWSNNFNFPALDFGFRAAGQNADIVIYGDSSATHDIDPIQMSKALGLRVLIIPGNSSLLAMTGDMPLQHYLRADKAPRLIVLYFAPWEMNTTHENIKAYAPYDGLEMLVRNGTPGEIYAFAKTHPTLLAEFPLMFYSWNLPKLLKSRQIVRAQGVQVKATNGYTDYPPTGLYPQNCAIPNDLLKKIHFDSVRDMARRLQDSASKVLVFAAPIPDCLGAETAAAQPYQDIPADPPRIMSSQGFGADAYYIHLHPAAVPAATESLTEAARAALAAPQN